jgi:hypothetical protein
MTTARQKRKHRDCLALCAVVAVAIAVSVSLFAGAASAGLTERIVVDWHTGLAIGGYDPVAFFTERKPMPGSAAFELRHDGVVWRFCNSGNRAAFAARPDIYMPRYGGYDPVGVARGVAVAGRPNVWLIAGDRLFLFYEPADRQKFAGDAVHFIATADRKWPQLQQTLTP